MDTSNLARLREKTGITQTIIAQALGVSLRSVSAWESASQPKQFSPVQARGIQELLMPGVLDGPLSAMAEEAHGAIPSEISAIWLVHGDECRLLPAAARRHDFQTGRRSEVPSALCSSTMGVDSLTTWPLKTGETINLAGPAILRHPAKKHKQTRAAMHFRGGVCESLLHVPAFTPSPRGPRPVLLLSLENKLNVARDDVIVTDEKAQAVYSEADMTEARRLAESFRDGLLSDLRLLGILP